MNLSESYKNRLKVLSGIILSESTNDIFIYHGTAKGQALSIQRDGFMNLNNTGEKYPSISFSKDLNYAKYYAQMKGGSDKAVVLRTKLTNNFQLSPRITKNKGYEYVTFKKLSSADLEIMTADNIWHPLEQWDIIINEPLNEIKTNETFLNEIKLIDIFGEYPHQDELIWEFIGPSDLTDTDFAITTVNVKDLATADFIQNFKDNAEPWQKKVVKDMVKHIQTIVDKPLIVDLEIPLVIDGNHKLMALYLAGITTVRVVDINQ